MRLVPSALVLFALTLTACQTGGGSAEPGAIAPLSGEAAPPASQDRFEPAKGVECRNSTQVCEWQGGPTVGLTRLFFGDAAAAALAPKAAATHYRNDPIFKPNPDASCDTLVTTCYDRGGVSVALTKKQFGTDASLRLQARKPQIVRYGKHVTCDEASKICYDRLGAGVGITQLYIGDAESQALLARLRTR